MTVNEIREYVNLVLNKDQQGNSLSPDELNFLFEKEIFNFTLDGIAKYKQTAIPAFDFHELIVSNTGFTSGVLAIPSNYLDYNSVRVRFAGYYREAEVVPLPEYYKRLNNILAKQPDHYPICYFDATNVTVKPSTCSDVNLLYYKKPAIPVFDYYIDANDNIVFLASGDYTLGTGETYSDGTTSGTKTSKTVELDLLEFRHQQFADYMLSKMGVRVRDQLLYQTAEIDKNK